MTDLVATVAASVDYDDWTSTEAGELIPQQTTATTIHDMLRMLNVRPGMSVLEIGTGSGYSGALLAGIVGDGGRVVSIDIDAGLVARAQERHRDAGLGNIEVHTADGFHGWKQTAPYDRIVGWVTPHLLPTGWVEQTAPAGVIVAPVKITDVAAANAIVKCVVDDGRPRDGRLQAGSFIEMAPEIITDFGMPIRYVNGVRRLPDAPPWWISGRELHGRADHTVEGLLDRLVEASIEPGFVDESAEDWTAITSFVLASTSRPASVGGPDGWGIGVATPHSVAVCLRNGALLAAGADTARDELTAAIEEWRRLGKPDLAELTPAFGDDDDGWTVRPRRAIPADHPL